MSFRTARLHVTTTPFFHGERNRMTTISPSPRQRVATGLRVTLALFASLALALAAPAPALAQELAQEAVTGSTVLLGGDVARLELELGSGETRTIVLAGGTVEIDGESGGAYEVGGEFERAWRDLLRDPALAESTGLADRLAAWDPPGTGTAHQSVLAALRALEPASAAEAPPSTAGSERVTIAPRAGSLGQLAERLTELRSRLERISGEDFALDGDFALVVYDDYRIADGTTIDGDVALLGGRLTVEGKIDGSVVVLGGDLDLEPGALVMGDVRSVGGDVDTSGATVTGEILGLSMLEDAIDASSDEVVRNRARERRGDVDGEWDGWDGRHDRSRDRGFFGSIVHTIGESVGGLLGTLAWLIGLTLIGAVLVYFAPDRFEIVTSEAQADLLRSFGVGLAAQFLFFPVTLLLVVLIVTWLVIPFYLLAVAVAIPVGYLAVARGIGEAVVDRRYATLDRFNLNRSNTYYYVLNGLIVLLSPFALGWVLHLLGGWMGFIQGLAFFVGVVLTWAAATTGFGAVILTRGGGLARGFPGFRRGRRRGRDPFEEAHAPAGGTESGPEVPIDETTHDA